jgi:hypothetical protein
MKERLKGLKRRCRSLATTPSVLPFFIFCKATVFRYRYTEYRTNPDEVGSKTPTISSKIRCARATSPQPDWSAPTGHGTSAVHGVCWWRCRHGRPGVTPMALAQTVMSYSRGWHGGFAGERSTKCIGWPGRVVSPVGQHTATTTPQQQVSAAAKMPVSVAGTCHGSQSQAVVFGYRRAELRSTFVSSREGLTAESLLCSLLKSKSQTCAASHPPPAYINWQRDRKFESPKVQSPN